MTRPAQSIDDLAKRNVIYQDKWKNLDWKSLVEKYDSLHRKRMGLYIDNGECARLPQVLTDVGHTSRWHRGPRVLDLSFLLPGTVIANFKLKGGKWKYPNESGYHAALFNKFEGGAMLVNGLPCEFSVFDQYKGKPAALRGLAILTPAWKKSHDPKYDVPSNRADDFYVVVVP